MFGRERTELWREKLQHSTLKIEHNCFTSWLYVLHGIRTSFRNSSVEHVQIRKSNARPVKISK